jgi:hypothetical protein
MSIPTLIAPLSYASFRLPLPRIRNTPCRIIPALLLQFAPEPKEKKEALDGYFATQLGSRRRAWIGGNRSGSVWWSGIQRAAHRA